MVDKISTFIEWADKRREFRCNKKEISPCMPGKGSSDCVNCYEVYVKSCLSQSLDMRSSARRGSR
jgi:hypothetical protein